MFMLKQYETFTDVSTACTLVLLKTHILPAQPVYLYLESNNGNM